MNELLKKYCLLGCLVLQAGCVSSSLNSVKETNTQIAKEPTYDLALREEAVAEIRAKAEKTDDKKTNVFRNQDGPGKPLSQAQVKSRMKALNSVAEEQSNRISDDELAAKKQSINELRKRARTHYSDRLEKIENE